MSSFPPEYKSIGFQYSKPQPARTDAQKQADHWREHNQSISQKNTARGRALQEKNGSVPTFNDVYAVSSAENRAASEARQAEIDSSAYAIKWPMSMLPPSDPIRQEAKRKHFGQPTHEQEMEAVKEQAALSILEAKIAELERKLQ